MSSDKDARVCVSLCSSAEIFLTKLNFLVRHRALADLSPITMDAGVFDVPPWELEEPLAEFS